MDMQNTTTKSFRNDINGLRAWAVASVVLYHFGIPGFRGGFVGVDIFFVISGFLMTGLIVRGLEKNDAQRRFSVFDFYLARARRIAPALIVLCAVLMLLGWFFLPALAYEQLGQHAATALVFVSNIKFWLETGYFDAASHEKWLLHTWSLSVEWQFYMLLPLGLMVIWRLWPGRKAMTASLATGFAASLALSIWLTPIKPTSAFYLLHTRAWEMLAGGLVFMLAGRWALTATHRRWLELVGFGLLIGAIVLTDPGAKWPGYLALVPVTGAVLVLWAARAPSMWTGTRLAQWLGNASYSIYLWHWPVVVSLVYLDSQKNPLAVCIGILTSIFLGYASYALVEQTSRKRMANLSWQFNALTWMVGVSVVAVPCLVIYMKQGVTGRLDPRVDAIFLESKNKNPRILECHVSPPAAVPECKYGGPNLGVIVVGDSHAATIIRTVEKAMAAPDKHVLDWTYAGCPTLTGASRTDPKYGSACGKFTESLLSRQKDMATVPMIIVNRSAVYTRGFNELDKEPEFGKPLIYFVSADGQASKLSFEAQFRQRLIDTTCEFAKVRPVYLMRPIPELVRDVPKIMGRSLIFGHGERVSISLAQYHERNDTVWAAQDAAKVQCGVQILDPLPYLCHDGRCWGDKDGKPLYFDNNHLSEYGASFLTPMFQVVFNR